ncbi:uncharacterized protein LOC114541766 [Dendronephthya gigantea]|uniref:uncharacterized protein LOC114541766 n=1 Tax=Dendronephthya gigantea TaxID=151771 RepID=UPI00106C0F34|nr:uncharacterized protein LOC114541766 [Dendronephthya gigantea]
MAPELYLENLKNASQAELQQCDIWSLGMVMYSILNPNVMSPYSKELENTGLSFDKDLLMNHCIPLHDEKYESIRVSEWWQVEECFKLCSNFLPNQRPTAAQVLDILTSQPANQLILKHLAVSQNTALERSDGKFAVLNEMTSFAETLQAPVNDGTNCCAFLGLGICDQILHDIAEAREVNWRRIIDISEHMINNLPLQLHGSRDLTSTYDVSEAYDILKSINLLTFSYELSEEFVKGKKVFSYGGREELMKSLGQKAASEKTCVGLYTCSPYTFVLGIHAESFFLVDTHCIGSEVGGNGNGILITTKDCSPSSCNVLTQWIIKRLKCSGIDGKEDQSLVWLTVEQVIDT